MHRLSSYQTDGGLCSIFELILAYVPLCILSQLSVDSSGLGILPSGQKIQETTLVMYGNCDIIDSASSFDKSVN